MTNAAAQRIVVGVDGSEGAGRALAWALEEATHRGARVDAVWAWHVPWLTNVAEVGTTISDASWFEDVARKGLDGAVDGALAAFDGDVTVERILAQGDASRALLDVAAGADLLVVGSRGRGGFSGLLLGSVSQQVATHASCPVVLVPPA